MIPHIAVGNGALQNLLPNIQVHALVAHGNGLIQGRNGRQNSSRR